MLLLWILGAVLLGGALSVVLAGAVLWLPNFRGRLLGYALPYATGALLATALLGLLPHALEDAGFGPALLGATLLAGILLFFVLEKLVLWRHCHDEACEQHGVDAVPVTAPPPARDLAAGPLIVVGDAVHNFVDGVLIAGAFLSDPALGLIASLAVIAHEIPQEVGDTVILVHSGYSRLRALGLNFASGLAAVPGALAGYWLLSGVSALLPFVLTLAAASFLYIAVADLIPGLHRDTAPRQGAVQVGLISCGIATVALTHALLAPWLG